MLYANLQRQAAMLSYIDVLWMLAVLSVVGVGFALLVRPTQRGGGGGKPAEGAH